MLCKFASLYWITNEKQDKRLKNLYTEKEDKPLVNADLIIITY